MYYGVKGIRCHDRMETKGVYISDWGLFTFLMIHEHSCLFIDFTFIKSYLYSIFCDIRNHCACCEMGRDSDCVITVIAIARYETGFGDYIA